MAQYDITIGALAKKLNLGRNNLYHLLRTCNILTSENLPHIRYKGMGYFKILTHEIPTKNGIAIKKQTLLTPKGAGWLKEKISLLLKELPAPEPFELLEKYQQVNHKSITKAG